MEKCRIQPKCFPSPPRHGQFTSKKQKNIRQMAIICVIKWINRSSLYRTQDFTLQSHVIIYYTSPKNVIYFWFSWYFVRDTAAAAHKNAIDKMFISLFLVDKICCFNQSFYKMRPRCILLANLTKARNFFFAHKRTFLTGHFTKVRSSAIKKFWI